MHAASVPFFRHRKALPMSDADDLAFDSSTFLGRVRLFPLQSVGIFPHVMQPLHIFEPRYRAMLEEAVAADRLIAMSLLAPGWEPNYEGRPALEPVACLGRVVTYQKVPDERYNLLLLGLKRVRIVRELPPDKLFREAEVEVLEDVYPSKGADARGANQQRLVQAFQGALPKSAKAREQFEQLVSSSVPLGVLTDIMAFTLELGQPMKYRLLAEPNVDARAELLWQHLQQQTPVPTDDALPSDFPPKFSTN